MAEPARTVGDIVRSWREVRRFSQLDLAVEAGVSQRHVSFIESGRAAPSREMILHLAEYLDVPLRERNVMLLAGGYAPVYSDRSWQDPALAPAKAALDHLLSAHEPYPALAVDRHWNIISANRALLPLLEGVDPELLSPPANALRISLHPRGLAPRIVNLGEWRQHLLDRLRRQFRICHDPALNALLRELSEYPFDLGVLPKEAVDHLAHDIALPLRLRSPNGILSFLSTVTVFGTPVEVALSEVTLEAFYPADQATAQALGIAK
jgi:transcriptional regulator with XRE-family HTH domain